MSEVTIYISREIALPDNDQWQHRFNIKSESSDRLYTVAQNKSKKHWGCSCPAYRTRRRCKHLAGIGLPANETPYEPKILNT